MCWSDDYSRRVVGTFREYWRDEERYENTFETLEEYIQNWMEEGNATTVTGGDYVWFLQAVLILIDAYEKDPSLLDFGGSDHLAPFKRPRVKSFLNLKEWGSECFDPRVYHGWHVGQFS